MKKSIFLRALMLLLVVSLPVNAFKDAPSLSLAERAALIGGKIAGAFVGAKALKELGRRYVDSDTDADESLDLNLDQDLDLDLDINLDDEGSDSPVSSLKDLDLDLDFKLDEFDFEENEFDFKEDDLKNMLFSILKPGQRLGCVGGVFIGYVLGGIVANRAIAFRHGVRFSTEKICRFFKINIRQYKALVVSAEKRDLKLMRSSLEELYAKRFGPDWEKKLHDLLYKYENYANFLVLKKSKASSESQKDFLRMIELGVAINSMYQKKKPSYAKSVEFARSIYQALGFRPTKEIGF